MIKRDRGLVAIIQMQNDPFFDSLWPFYMIKINLVILHLCRTKKDAKNRANDAKIQSQHVQKKEQMMQKKTQFDGPELGFLLGPITTVFFHRVSGGRVAEHNQ